MNPPLALSLEKAGAPTTSEGKPPPTPAGAPICTQHPLLPARTCRQCSEFYCVHCLPADARRVLCLHCNTPLALREAPEKLRALFRDLWISPLVMGIGVLLGSIALSFSESGIFPVQGLIPGTMVGVIASLPLFVVPLLVAANRSTAAAWIGFGFEVLLLILLVRGLLRAMTEIGSGVPMSALLLFILLPTLFVIAAALVPILTIVQFHQVRELQALIRAHQKARPVPLPAHPLPAHS